MSSSANPHARLIFKDAFDKLKETVDSINPQHTRIFQNTKLEDVFNASREIEQALAKRNCLRNMRRLTPFLRSLEHYSKSVEVLCNGTPYLPWIWAPIKVTLQIASEFPAAMEKLIAVYSKITEVIPRFDRLSEAFKKDQTLHRVMAMAYADILDFHREAYGFFSQPGWRIFFSTLWGKAERRFKVILDSLAENCRLVETEAKTADIVEASSFRVKMKEQVHEQENERIVNRLQAALAWLGAKDEEQESELDRLRGRIFEHSCDWIQRHNEAKAWMSMRGSQPILWLIGKPGAGKSTLSATIIQFLLQDRHSAVLYYLCNHQSSKSTDSAHVIRTLVSQLLRLNNDMAEHIYEEHITNGHAPSVPRLKQLLQTLLGSVPSTRIIIDGVDELEDPCRSQVLSDVLGLATVPNSKTTRKVLVSSRDISSISKIMSKYPVLNLNKERRFLDTSITSFVHQGLYDMRSQIGQTQDADNRIYREIEQNLIDKAEGMFLWIRLVIHALQDSSDILELRRTVHELPKDLDQMYSKVLDRMMKDLGPSKWEAVKTIFIWMVHGARYLKSFELLSAVSLHLGSMSQGYYAYEWEWALHKCKPLLEITNSGTVSFTHCTVHEYFTKGTGIMRIDPLRAHLEISHGCLSCLTQGLEIMNPQWSRERRMLEVAGGRYALIKYSMDYWLKHLFDSLNRMNSRSDLDAILDAIDELDDRHGVIKELCSSKKSKPITESELLDESVLSREILDIPHLKDMLIDHLRFECSLKKQEFASGKKVDYFRSEYDPGCFSMTSQTYQDVVHQIIESDGHYSDPSIKIYMERFKQQFASFAYFCRFWGCGAYSSSVTELETHETMHSGGIKCDESTCPFSNIGFTSAVALKRHMRKHHPQEINIAAATKVIRRKHICSGLIDGVDWGCKQRFAVERELRRHISSRQGTSCDQSYMKLQQTPAFVPPAPQQTAAASQVLHYKAQPQQQQPKIDNDLIMRLAVKLMQKVGDEVKQKFQQDVASWSAETRQQLMNQNIDPLMFRFRQHAEMMLRSGMTNAVQLEGPQVGSQMGGPMQQLGQPNQMQNQQMNQRQSNQEFDFNAIANQQIEALRFQDQGQQVVPESNNVNGTQMGFPGQPPQTGQAQSLAQRRVAFQNPNLQRQAQAQAQQQQPYQSQQQFQAQVQRQQPYQSQRQAQDGQKSKPQYQAQAQAQAQHQQPSQSQQMLQNPMGFMDSSRPQMEQMRQNDWMQNPMGFTDSSRPQMEQMRQNDWMQNPMGFTDSSRPQMEQMRQNDGMQNPMGFTDSSRPQME